MIQDNTGTLEFIRAALQESDNLGLKEKMRLVRNTFLTHREMGQSEALYRIIPSMHLSDSSIGNVFVNTGRLKSKFLKKLSEDEAKATENVVTIADSDGLYVETSSIVDKYRRRPQSLLWMSLMQFAKRYTRAQPRKEDLKTIEEELESNIEEIDDLEDEGEEVLEEDFDVNNLPSGIENTLENDFIIHSERKRRTPLPDRIALSGPFYPGEPRFMKLRRPCVVRVHKFRKTVESHDYVFSQLELYFVFRAKEEREQCLEDFDFCIQTYIDNLESINYVRSKTMPFMNHVEECLEKADEVVNKDNIAESIDPQAAQDDGDCLEEGLVLEGEFVAFDYDKLEETYAEKSDALFKRIEVEGLEQLHERSLHLDVDQHFVLEKVINYVKHYKKSLLTQMPLPEPLRLKVIGSAGTGKSHLIDLICQWVEHLLRREGDNLDHPYVVKTAFTGSAACNIGGSKLLCFIRILLI